MIEFAKLAPKAAFRRVLAGAADGEAGHSRPEAHRVRDSGLYGIKNNSESGRPVLRRTPHPAMAFRNLMRGMRVVTGFAAGAEIFPNQPQIGARRNRLDVVNCGRLRQMPVALAPPAQRVRLKFGFSQGAPRTAVATGRGGASPAIMRQAAFGGTAMRLMDRRPRGHCFIRRRKGGLSGRFA